MTEIFQRLHPSQFRLPPAPPSAPVDLTQAITEFIHRLQSSQPQAIAPVHAPSAYQPKVLLALLTYFYARRVYPSNEIERAIRENKSLRAAHGQEYPSAGQLRQFRRHNRELLRNCLAYALARTQPLASETSVPTDARSVAATRPDLPSFGRLQEAEQHLEQAILLDSTDLDY